MFEEMELILFTKCDSWENQCIIMSRLGRFFSQQGWDFCNNTGWEYQERSNKITCKISAASQNPPAIWLICIWVGIFSKFWGRVSNLRKKHVYYISYVRNVINVIKSQTSKFARNSTYKMTFFHRSMRTKFTSDSYPVLTLISYMHTYSKSIKRRKKRRE